MSIKLVVTEDGKSVEIAMSEDVIRCIENTIGYRQDERKNLGSPDSEITYWLEYGKLALHQILLHQRDMREDARQRDAEHKARRQFVDSQFDGTN